jgi:hypothetical protein
MPKPILKKNISTNGRVEYLSIVQNRIGNPSDSDILLESFSDEEDNNISTNNRNHNNNNNNSVDKMSFECINTNDEEKTNDVKVETIDESSGNKNDAAEIRRMLRRKDELERKQKMQERYNERLQVSFLKKKLFIPRTN